MAGAAETGNEVLKDTQVAEIKTPEDEGSLAQIMEEIPRPMFTGHPALGEVESDETGPEGEEEAKPPEKAGEEEVGAAPPETAVPPEKEEKKFKHASWEETERAREEAEQRMHTATEDAANLRKENEEIKKQLAAKETAAPPEKPAEAPPSPSRDERKNKIKQALDTIRNLDQYDPEYNEKVAEAWAEAGFGAPGVPLPDTKELAKEAARIAREEIKAEQEAAEAERTQKREQEESTRTWDKAVDLAGKAGLDMTAGSADARLFRSVALEVPEEVKTKPLADQVTWAVGEVRRMTGKVVQTQEELNAAARQTQVANAVLEKGGTRPKAAPKRETYSLGSILDRNKEARVI